MSFILLNRFGEPAGGVRLLRAKLGSNTEMFRRAWDAQDADSAPHHWHPTENYVDATTPRLDLFGSTQQIDGRATGQHKSGCGS